MDRRTIRSWALYDFGNSAFAALFPFVFGVYYTQHVVGNADGRGDAWWGRISSTSMLLVALSSPLLGGIADHAGIRKRMLALYTAVGVAAVLAFSGVGPGMVVAGFFLGVLANFAFEGGNVFYNSFLPEIAPPSHQGRVSGLGFGVGYAGSLVAIGGAVLVLGRGGPLTAIWILLGCQWALFALPALRNLPHDRRSGLGVLRAARQGVRQTFATLRDVLGMRDLRRFLLAYFFYEDGVNTVIIFSSIYATTSLGFTMTQALGLLALVQVSALAGSFAMAGPTDRIGPKRVVRGVLLWWIVVVTAAYFAQTKLTFSCVAALAGLGLGSIQAASRAFMARLVPAGREAEMFGFYALCGKSGAILGPLLFGELSQRIGQRGAILSVAVFYAVGYLLLRRVNLPAPCSSSDPK